MGRTFAEKVLGKAAGYAVKAGDVVTVRVVEVDVPRKRIGLTMRKDSADAREQARERRDERGADKGKPARGPMRAAPKQGGGGNAFADALKGKFGR